MARFVKVGETLLNLDAVSCVVRCSDGCVDVWFIGQGSDDEAAICFRKDNAAALFRFLAAGATDITPTGKDDDEFMEYLARGGTMARYVWDAKQLDLRDAARLADVSPAAADRAEQLEAELLY